MTTDTPHNALNVEGSNYFLCLRPECLIEFKLAGIDYYKIYPCQTYFNQTCHMCKRTMVGRAEHASVGRKGA